MSILYKILSVITSLIVFLSGGIPAVDENVTIDDYEGLKDVYADYFDIGTCVGSSYLDNEEQVKFLLKNYSSVTPEWELKVDTINPAEGVWNFAGMDKIADFCRQNNIKVRGHCLVWGQLSNWMLYDENGDFVSKEVYYERQNEYIRTVMLRYKDVVKVWDVTNEVLGYDLADGEFKQYDVYKLCGEEYVEKAFEQARAAVPDAVLVFNENGLAKNVVKQGYLQKWLKIWLDKGVPIDAVGIQGHSNTVSINETCDRLEAVIKIIKSTGIKEIQITEIDMSLYLDKHSGEEIFDWQRDYQTLKYKHLFKLLRKYSDIITSVTFWGPDDAHSCLTSSDENDSPLIFDRSMKPKSAYYAITDF